MINNNTQGNPWATLSHLNFLGRKVRRHGERIASLRVNREGRKPQKCIFSMLTATVTVVRRRIAILAVTCRWWMPADFPIIGSEWQQCGWWSLPASTFPPFSLLLLLVLSSTSSMFFFLSVNWLRTLPKAKWPRDRFHFPQIDRKTRRKSERTTRAKLKHHMLLTTF